jgi:hygromycin-B 7''-O-kinase
MGHLLPPVADPEEYWRLHGGALDWRPAAEHICRLHGLPAPTQRAARGGSVVVHLGDRLFLKLFAPIWRHEHDGEVAALGAAAGEIGLATPRIVASGELDGWAYLVMTGLRGAPLDEVWDSIAPNEQARLAAELGQALSRLHAVRPPEALARVDWRAFLRARVAGCAEQHRRAGAPERIVREIPKYVASRLPELETGEVPVLLHADVTREHVLFARGAGGRWEITGLIDFGDARVGPREYEFAAPGALFLRERADLQRPFLRAYGYREEELTRELAGRLTAFVVLHEFGNLARYLARFSEPAPATLEELESRLWPLA